MASCFEHGSVEPEATAVDEVSFVGKTDIDLRGEALNYEARDLAGGVVRNSDGLGEVVASAGRDDSERAAAAGPDDRIGDAAARTIAPDDDDRRPPRIEGLARDAFLVTARGGLLDVVNATCGEALRDCVESPPRGAFSGRGVDDQPRVLAQRGSATPTFI